MKIVTWNVNGLRSVLSKGLDRFLETCAADVVCLQEIKARPEQVEVDWGAWRALWNPALRPGYSGVLVLSRREPLRVLWGVGDAACDAEGRALALEFPSFYLVNLYAPNAGPELARLGFKIQQWSPALRAFLLRLEQHKPVVFCGDMNVAVEDVDLARPKANEGKAGFTTEEREDFRSLLRTGYVDAFREFEKGPGHYTWWSYRSGARERNVGWRIDYICISRALLPALRSSRILSHVGGSDHCPVEAELTIS